MIKSGSMKLLGAFAVTAIASAAWSGHPQAARADDTWTQLHRWHLECRFLLDNKGSGETCHAAADLCQLNNPEVSIPENRQLCSDVLRVQCGGTQLYEGLALHGQSGAFEIISAQDGQGKAIFPQLAYPSDHPGSSEFLIDAWLATDSGRAEGFCRVHGNAM